MKNKYLVLIAVAMISFNTYSQTQNVDQIIDSYIVYIQDINANEVFQPETVRKSILVNGEEIEHDITYFSTDENNIFSIIVQSYASPEVKTTYYFKNNKVISVFIEENNFSSDPKDKQYRNYFIKDDQIILEEPINSSDDYKFFIHLGKTLGHNYIKKQ